jgi:hypothetical protein
MEILDFGAGLHARHTIALRERFPQHAFIAHDFGRNWDPRIHDRSALQRQYDLVFASNVINVHCTHQSLWRTIATIGLATRGEALVNYPRTPRKLNLSTDNMFGTLSTYFEEVSPVGGGSDSPVWRCAGTFNLKCRMTLEDYGTGFTAEELAAATVRPAGAVGRRPIVVALVNYLLTHYTLQTPAHETQTSAAV